MLNQRDWCFSSGKAVALLDSLVVVARMAATVMGGRPTLLASVALSCLCHRAPATSFQTRNGRSTSVVVNVDASGTEVQGNQGNADQLGRLIGQAVQAELIKQKRPGGLLTR